MMRRWSLAATKPLPAGLGLTSKTSAAHVLISERDPGGHRLVYVKLLARDALASGIEVTLALTDEVLNDVRFALHLAELHNSVRIVRLEEQASLHNTQRLAQEVGASFAVVPDGLPYGLDMLTGRRLRKGPRLRLVIMNDPRWSMANRSGLRLRERWKMLFFKLAELRPSQDLYWLRAPGYYSSKEKYVTDPIVLDGSIEQIRHDAKELRRELDMSPDTFWFGIVGSLEKRKNIPMLLEAAVHVVSQTTQPVGIALLGPWFSDSVPPETDITLAATSGIRIVRRHQHMTNYELNVAISALDCVVLPYSTSAPNSTMAKASSLGIRVAAAGPPSFCRFAEEITGRPGVPLQADCLGRELLRALKSPSPSVRRAPTTSGFSSPLLRRGSS